MNRSIPTVFVVTLSFCLALSVIWTPAKAETKLIFPRLAFEAGTITGIAIINPGEVIAEATVTAYGPEGEILTAPRFKNPAQIRIAPGSQYTNTTVGLFGRWPESETVAWFEVVFPNDNLTGFFLHLDQEMTYFDGADLPDTSKSIVFNDLRIGNGFDTELNLINSGDSKATIELEFLGIGDSRKKQIILNPKGIVRVQARSFFDISLPVRGYVVAKSTSEIGGFEFVGGPGDILGLNASPAEETLKTIYFPQLAVLGPFESEVVLVNSNLNEVVVTLSAFQPDGRLYGPPDVQRNPVTRALSPAGVLNEDVAEMFGFKGSETRDGWLKAESTSESVYGSLSYSVPGAGSLAAVSGVRQGSRHAVFSHIATSLGFFTGIALLNGGSLAANVHVEALLPDGSSLGSFRTTLRPGERLSKLITELIPGSDHQAGGLILVTSDVPVYLTSLFGNLAGGVLANIPAQPVPESYQTNSGTQALKVTPKLVVMSPTQERSFVIENSDGTGVTWKVNGTAGGNPQVGTITSAGRYQAPYEVPVPLPVTVTATVNDQTAGASVDVLRKETIIAGLGAIQSISYLKGLDRLFTAELSTLGALSKKSAEPLQDSTTTIFDVTEGQRAIYELPGETISKMIAFPAIDGREYLLLASQTAGRIVRLDPQTSDAQTVAAGLDAPRAIVLEPSTGDLLVAEDQRVSVVFKAQLNLGLTYMSLSGRQQATVGRASIDGRADGLAVDRCTGNILASVRGQGLIREFNRRTNAWRTLADGLSEPEHLLILYRDDVSCPSATHLLVVERGQGRLVKVSLEDGETMPWTEAPGIRDLAFYQSDSKTLGGEGVLLGETSLNEGSVILVETPNLYREAPPNTPLATSLPSVPLDGCATLDRENTTYRLTRDLAAPEIVPNCMNIVADGVTLDCQGHSLIDSSIEFAALVYSESDFTTVRNCTVTAASGPQGEHDGAGIYLRGNYGVVEFNHPISSFWGIRAEGSHHLIQYNIVADNAKGIHIEGNDHLVQNNLCRNNNKWQSFGLALWNGRRNRFLNNNVYGSRWGLIMYGASEIEVMDCGVLGGATFLYTNSDPIVYLPCLNPDCQWNGDVCQ